jgi:hypothetical protein
MLFGWRSRVAAIGILMALTAGAAPTLVTIQDVLYKADGSRFTGVAFIEWQSFVTADSSNIATQSVTVEIVNGNLRVQLVPTTTASNGAYYSVKYSSDGRIQFTETWSVPSSTTTLRLSDVRTGSSSSGSSSNSTSGSSDVLITDVIGLAAELAARPVKSSAYTASRAAIINSLGEISAASGNTTDCVHVDGSSGSCGTSSSTFVENEVPSGSVDGTNRVFVLAGAPSPSTSLQVHRNGLLQNLGTDYTLSSKTITFSPNAVPQASDILLAAYRMGGASSLAALTGSTTPQVLCGNAGAGTSSTTLVTLASCSIAAGTLQPGDRLELRFDYAHTGVTSGFTVEMHWGSTTMVSRAATATETLVTGKSEAAVHASGTEWSAQSWGTALPLAVGIGNATDSTGSDLTISFLARAAATTADTVTLRSYMVLRYPAVTVP